MYYEEDFVEEVRQRSDVVDIISSYVNLKRDFGVKEASYLIEKEKFSCFFENFDIELKK